MPIIAVALMLMSQRARLNGPVFVIGRPRPGHEVEAPKWMGSIERFTDAIGGFSS